MAVSVIVPYRSDCAHRAAAWRWVRARYELEHPDWQIIEGEPPDGPWCKALAAAAGIARADGDTLIVTDADVWCPELTTAVEGFATWAVPHYLVRRLTEQATLEVLAGDRPDDGTELEQRPYRGMIGGGIVIVTRDLWHEAPLDARFVGWGQEDQSWGAALSCIAGRPWRGTAPLWHLWHPPQARLTREIGSIESKELRHRYLNARRHPDLMRQVIEEGRHAHEVQA